MFFIGATAAYSSERVIAFGDRTVLMGAETSLHGELKVAHLGSAWWGESNL
jgi:hypothetical protein